MSKAAKKSIFLLIFLLIGALILFCIYALKSQELESSNKELEKKAQESEGIALKKTKEAKELKTKVQELETENISLKEASDGAQAKVDQLNIQVDTITSERDNLSGRISNIKKERDQLIAKVQEMKKGGGSGDALSAGDFVPDESLLGDDEYWAKVLRDKASLQIKMDGLKDRLAQNSVEMVDIKQKNADLQIALDTLQHGREEIEREIKHKEALINNLSLELARTKNDKKFVNNRVATLNEENSELRKQLKELFTTKSGLEKTIVKLQQEKKAFERRVNETDSLIQSKIDEIWEIKESLDRTFQSTSLKPSASNSVELPPIVVNSNQQMNNAGPVGGVQESDMIPGFNAKVVSVNTDNNFIIVDIGEKAGVRLGDTLSVYRDSKYIARLEVIQVRKDIAAADIKDQWSKVVVGDLVK